MISDKKVFKGRVDMYGEEMYVNTSTGEGLDGVLHKIDPLLNKMAAKTYLSGMSFEDIKHELVILAIEGVRSYDSSKSVKLSTFLHVHLHNKLISKIKEHNKASLDATLLHKDVSFCEDCREKLLMMPKKGNVYAVCVSCKEVKDTNIKNIKRPVNFSDIITGSQDGEQDTKFVDIVVDGGPVFSNSPESIKDLEVIDTILKIADHTQDPRTGEVLRLICLEDYNIKDAAVKAGLTSWAASSRLKKLCDNDVVKEYLNLRK